MEVMNAETGPEFEEPLDEEVDETPTGEYGELDRGDFSGRGDSATFPFDRE